MPAEIVNPPSPALFAQMYPAAMRAYLTHDRGLAVAWRRKSVDPELAWIAHEHGRVVGTLRTIEDTITVPGAPGAASPRLDADLLSLVSVAPTHRRQGLLTRMLGQSLTRAAEHGKPVSVLVAAEWPIYGRFGYAPAAFETTFEVDTRRAGARIIGGEPTGSMQEIDVVEASELAPPTYEAESALRAGLIGRDELWWDRELRRMGEGRTVIVFDDEKPAWHAIHRDGAGAVDGYVRWSVLRRDEGRELGALHVEDVLTSTPVAYREVWRFLLGIDLIDTLHVPNRPVDDPLPWLLADGRVAGPSQTGDAMWLRILDVPAALAARGYGVEDELVLDVVDPAVGHWASGRWRLTASPDGAQCVPAGAATPDITLPQASLASLYLGGVRAAVLARTGGFDEHMPGAGARLDRLFATPLAPWRATDF